MSFSAESPFDGPVPPTVPLSNTPLTGALIQIAFPEVLSIARLEYIAVFQERIRTDYPLHRQERNLVLQLAADGARPTELPNWRFFDVEKQWRLSLTTSFVALETRAYTSREDIIQRTVSVARALSETINPNFMTRIGVRYVDRVHGVHLERLAQFVRPEILGIYHHTHRENIRQTFGEMLAHTDAGSMTSRWGFMPPNQTHEPDLMPPIETPSWFLDTDVYQTFARPEAFAARDIEIHATKLATRAYGFFRWVVNDKFLAAHGGEL